MTKYLIVSLDGGGVRCALQIIILRRIFTRFPQLEGRIRLVAGTSAGALVGAALAALGCAKMVEHMLAQSFAKKIFTESWAHEVRSMRGLYRSNYTNRELAKLLATVFGDNTLLNHYSVADGKPDLLITSFCIDTSVGGNSKITTGSANSSNGVVSSGSMSSGSSSDVNAAQSATGNTTVNASDCNNVNAGVCNKCRPTSAGAISASATAIDSGSAMAIDSGSATATPTAAEKTAEITTETTAAGSGSSSSSSSGSSAVAIVRNDWARWPTFLANLSSLLRWSKAGESVTNVGKGSGGGDRGSENGAAAQTTTAIVQEACNQQKLHQSATHKCTCSAWHAQLYHTFVGGNGGTVTFVDALLQTTSAPTYFPAHNGCVDGGVIAQNPALFAITHALRYAKHADGQPLRLDDIVLLSIGTGSHPMNMNTYGKSADLGLAQWVPNLMCLFNDASLDATDINCRNLLPAQQYLRVQVRMPRAVDLANYNEWSELVLWAEQEPLDGVFAQIEALFAL